jgi:hydroxymethylbilane synthase
VGTRGSALARAQTGLVLAALQRAHPASAFEVQIISTHGDETAGRDDSQLDGQGAFVRRIEATLRAGEIDVAVHSAKDMPSADPEGLVIGAFPTREDPRDALITTTGMTLATLQPGAVVGTGSPRRRALLLDERPDIVVRPIRGNVDTRLRRIGEGEIAGVVLAAAGLRRLGRDPQAREILEPTRFVPAVGQGILAVQVRAADEMVLRMLSAIDDPTTRACALAERGVALAFGAGCQTPLGAYARLENGSITLDAFVAPDGGGAPVRAHRSGPIGDAASLGRTVGEALRAALRATGAA